MYKKLAEVQKETGLSRAVLLRIAHSKGAPVVKTSKARNGRWMFDMEGLAKWLASHTFI